MKKRLSLYLSFALAGIIALTAINCGSTDITSARLYIQQKNYEKAIEALKREITKNPKSEEGFYLLGTLYGEKEYFDSMITAYNNALAVGKKFEKDIKSTKKMYWGNNFNKGAQLFNKATQTKNDSSKIYYQKSAEAFVLATKIEPDSVDAYRNLAYVYLNLGKYQETIEPLKKIIAVKKDKDAYKLLGQVYLDNATRAKDAKDEAAATAAYDEAIKYFEYGRKNFPDDQEMLTELSNAYISANKASVAMGTFKELVDQNPDNPAFRFNYGVLLLGANDFAKAEEQFLAALDARPDYGNAMYNLAVTYVKWGAALQKKADEDNKENPQVREKFKAAVPQLESYVQNNQKDIQAWELLGKVYSIVGNTAEAQKAYETVDKLRSNK